ncbi:Fen2 protein [Martiniozyma asiatica (nom. inval.)]|nr:Fen2 protein [Martiniozyma asiatica]
MVLEKTRSFVWQYFKIDDPKTFRTDYIDQSIDRSRGIPKVGKWDKYNFLNAFAWYPSHYSWYEIKYLIKVDFCILFFLTFSFYTKYLDNSNVTSAYVSGMKEDLNLKGNELNYINTCYTVGFAAFQIPTTMLITKPQLSRHLLLFCELAWGLMTLANAYVRNVQEMYVVRFFIGVFEACSFPVTYVILSSYFSADELFKRCGFYGAGAVAGMASAGALQSSAMKHLTGINGLAGWRWQYIIDAVLTFGVFLYGFFLFPGIPSSTKKFGPFSEDDMTFARKRLEKQVSAPTTWTLKALKKTVSTWQLYVCGALWVLHHKVWYSPTNQLYMKSVPQYFKGTEVTTWDSYINADGIAFTLLVPPLCAYYGKLVPVNVVYLTAYFTAIVLLIYDVPHKVYMAALFLQQPFRDGLAQIFYSWFAVLCRDDVEKKALVLSGVQVASYAINAFSIPLQYDVSDSPRFRKGYIINLVIIICSHIVFFGLLFLEKFDRKYIPRFAGGRHEYDTDSDFSSASSEIEFSKEDARVEEISLESN